MKDPHIRCEHDGEVAKDPYHYTECGLDNVYLLSGYDIEQTEYGEVVSVRHADELHNEIGTFLVKNKKILSGKELRFLRKEMDLTQSELGKLLGLSHQAVARWEKDQTQMTGPAESLLRVLFLEHVGLLEKGMTIHDLLSALDAQDASYVDDKQMYEQENCDWKPVALAA